MSEMLKYKALNVAKMKLLELFIKNFSYTIIKSFCWL